MPTVSVLIPCYNAEKYIGETLESVFRQTWPDLEVIVVDDGSRDESRAEVARFPRTKLVQQDNAGVCVARNRAVAASTGDFIQYLDADDIIDPDKIALQMARLLTSPKSVASAEWGRFYGNPSDTRFDPEPVWQDLDPMDWLALSRKDGLGMLFPALWLIPRHVIEAAGPCNPALSRGMGEDGEYFTRVLLASDRVLFCEGARCRYRSGISGSNSRSKSPSSWAAQYLVTELCQQHLLAREDSDRVRRGLALSWQHFAHGSYPYAPDLAERALAQASALHGIRHRPGGGPAFKVISRLVGWRIARRLQVASGRP